MLIQQQRKLLAELDMQKSIYASDISQLQEQLAKTNLKIQQRTHDLKLLQKNYQAHLRSMRSTNDDLPSITHKLQELLHKIHMLATDLLPHAEPITSSKLGTLWINLHTSIQQLGAPLPPHRILMLTEKFMMDVLVQNLNINFFPGLSCNAEFLQIQQWFEKNGINSTRLRQELASRVTTDTKWKDRNWHHLYKGLQKAYPTYLANNKMLYKLKLKELVEYAMALGAAIKGHELCVTAVDVKEGVQLLNTKLMCDEDGQQRGVVAFCIVPPFVVKVGSKYEPLIKGRVLCFSK